MFAAPAEERPHGGAPQACGKDTAKPDSKVKKKRHSLKVTLPPLSREPPSRSAGLAFSRTPVLRSIPSGEPLSAVELPHLTVGPRRDTGGPGRGVKCTERTRLMAPEFETQIPIRTAQR